MTNPVFDNALATLRQLTGTVEAEIARLSSMEVRAQGAQQRIDALRVQERELQQTVNGMAETVASSRQLIEDAKAAAKKIIDDAREKEGGIFTAARQAASAIEARAHDAANGIVENAKREAEPYGEKIATAKRELEGIRSQIDAIHSQARIAENAIAESKRVAAAWASS